MRRCKRCARPWVWCISTKRHYEKVISACCFLFLFANVGLPSTSFSVYQPYLVELVGDAGGSLILAVRTFSTFLAMLIVNRYYNRLDCRVGVTVGGLFAALGFFVYGIADSLPLFALGAVFAGFGYSLGGVVGMTLVTGRWYKTRLGTAVGFATVGSGFAGMVVPPCAMQIIHAASLSAAFFAESAVVLAVAVVTFIFVRNYPEQVGARPFGADEAHERAGQLKRSRKLPGQPAGHDAAHLPRSARAALVAAMGCIGAVCVGAVAYLSILMTTSGFSHAFAACLLSVMGAALTVSKFGTGELFDKIGTQRASSAMFAVLLMGLALCCTAPLTFAPLAVAACVLLGAGCSLGSVGISVWALELSNASTRAKTVKDFQVGYALGSFVGDSFPGLLAEACGSYVPTYAIIFVLVLFSAAVIIRVYKKYR